VSLDRYQFTKKEQDRLKTTKYPAYEKRSSDRYIFSRDQDRLDLLANEFYKDPRYWWVIAEANQLGKGTLDVPAGIQLRIPFPIDDLMIRLRDSEQDK
jgi:nucleoid-associated protein YgaU